MKSVAYGNVIGLLIEAIRSWLITKSKPDEL